MNNSQINFPDLYPSRTQGMQWGTQKEFLSVEVVMNIWKTLFFATIKEWNMLDSNIQSSESLNVFKSKILKFIRPKQVLSLIAFTLKEWKWSQYCHLV